MVQEVNGDYSLNYPVQKQRNPEFAKEKGITINFNSSASEVKEKSAAEIMGFEKSGTTGPQDKKSSSEADLPANRTYKTLTQQGWKALNNSYNPQSLKDHPFYKDEVKWPDGRTSILIVDPNVVVHVNEKGEERGVSEPKYERYDVKKYDDGRTIVTAYEPADNSYQAFLSEGQPVKEYLVFDQYGTLEEVVKPDGTTYQRPAIHY